MKALLKQRALGRRHRHRHGEKLSDDDEPLHHIGGHQPLAAAPIAAAPLAELDDALRQQVRANKAECDQLGAELRRMHEHLRLHPHTAEQTLTSAAFHALLQRLLAAQNLQKAIFSSAEGHLIRREFPSLIERGTEMLELLDVVMAYAPSSEREPERDAADAMLIDLGTAAGPSAAHATEPTLPPAQPFPSHAPPPQPWQLRPDQHATHASAESEPPRRRTSSGSRSRQRSDPVLIDLGAV